MNHPTTRVTDVDGSGLRVGIVAARYNDEIVDRLLDGATAALARHGVAEQDVRVVWVPGAFEVPVVLERLAASGQVDVLVALGCVVRGETPHFDFVAGECAAGSAAVARQHGIAVGFGVLTTDTWDQALARAGGDQGNKGEEAVLAALETARVLEAL